MKKRVVQSIALMLMATGMATAGTLKTTVTVIDKIPTTTDYDWQVAGQSSTTCRGATCTSYFTPSSSGTSHLHGAVLQLQLPDGRIVIASCHYNKGNAAFGVIGAMTGDSNLNAPRSCPSPRVNDVADAKFVGSLAQISWREPSLDGKGRKHTEVYNIRGILLPAAKPADSGQTP